MSFWDDRSSSESKHRPSGVVLSKTGASSSHEQASEKPSDWLKRSKAAFVRPDWRCSSLRRRLNSCWSSTPRARPGTAQLLPSPPQLNRYSSKRKRPQQLEEPPEASPAPAEASPAPAAEAPPAQLEAPPESPAPPAFDLAGAAFEVAADSAAAASMASEFRARACGHLMLPARTWGEPSPLQENWANHRLTFQRTALSKLKNISQHLSRT